MACWMTVKRLNVERWGLCGGAHSRPWKSQPGGFKGISLEKNLQWGSRPGQPCLRPRNLSPPVTTALDRRGTLLLVFILFYLFNIGQISRPSICYVLGPTWSCHTLPELFHFTLFDCNKHTNNKWFGANKHPLFFLIKRLSLERF